MPAENPTKLQDSFKQHCKKLGLTQVGIANATGVTPQYISQLWKGQCPPSIGFATRAIIAGLAQSYDDVFQNPLTTQQAA